MKISNKEKNSIMESAIKNIDGILENLKKTLESAKEFDKLMARVDQLKQEKNDEQ